MPSLLDQLKEYTIVVADTGDINSIEEFTPRDATTNPSLIKAAAAMPEYAELVDAALKNAREQASDRGNTRAIINDAIDRLAIEFGRRILDIIPGRISTEVDARLSFDQKATIDKARRLIALYDAEGVDSSRVLIKIASTWEGIQAARELEKEGIHCNLTLLFGLHQAVACAEAEVTLISPFVGRILDWYKSDTGRDAYPAAEDPGVLSVTEIYNYYKRFGHKTEVMGASFRNIGEICELAGCDLLTISPKLLKELQQTHGDLPRKLDPNKATNMAIEPLLMTRELFDSMHADNPMATDKLAEGIDGFAKAQIALEETLTQRLSALS